MGRGGEGKTRRMHQTVTCVRSVSLSFSLSVALDDAVHVSIGRTTDSHRARARTESSFPRRSRDRGSGRDSSVSRPFLSFAPSFVYRSISLVVSRLFLTLATSSSPIFPPFSHFSLSHLIDAIGCVRLGICTRSFSFAFHSPRDPNYNDFYFIPPHSSRRRTPSPRVHECVSFLILYDRAGIHTLDCALLDDIMWLGLFGSTISAPNPRGCR